MRQPTLSFSVPEDGDGHQETPPAATSTATDGLDATATSDATNGEEVADDFATSEPDDRPDRGAELLALAAHWYRLGLEDATRHGGPFRTAWEGHGPSLADISRYAGERRWLPEDHPGGLVSSGIPVLYYRTAAPLAIAGALAWIWLWSRLLRITVAAAVFGITVLIVTTA